MMRSFCSRLLLVVATTAIALGGPAVGADTPADQKSQTKKQVKPLDLRAPRLSDLYTPEQIEQLTTSATNGNIDTVEVERSRVRAAPATPQIWGGIAAPVWALLHPSQGWRIFAPLPPEHTQATPSAAEVNETERKPVIPMR